MDISDQQRRKELFERRYAKDAEGAQGMLWNEHIELLLAHRSVRTFLEEDIPPGALETMVAAAQSASNSSNLNQWSLVAITDPLLKAEFARVSREGSKVGMGNPFIEQAPVLLLWVADMHRNSQIAKDQGLHSPVLAYSDATLMATIDTALAAQNAAVAAESMGLGIVYLGIMRNNAQQIADLLGLPDYCYVVFGMAVGKPDPQRRSDIRPRLAQKAVLHYNGYDKHAWKEHIDAYEESFKAFRERNAMKPKLWRDSVVFSTSSMQFMDGRENLKKALENRGLKLL